MGQTLQLLLLMSTDQVSHLFQENVQLFLRIHFQVNGISIKTAGGLAVDWINDKLYFSFGDPGSNLVNPNHLAVHDITAGGGYVEITTSDGPYHELVVDPVAQ